MIYRRIHCTIPFVIGIFFYYITSHFSLVDRRERNKTLLCVGVGAGKGQLRWDIGGWFVSRNNKRPLQYSSRDPGRPHGPVLGHVPLSCFLEKGKREKKISIHVYERKKKKINKRNKKSVRKSGKDKDRRKRRMVFRKRLVREYV